MNFESQYQLFLVAFNPEAEHFNDLIHIEPYSNFSDIQKEFKKAKFELYVDGQKKPKLEIIGIRESYVSSRACAMSYLKYHFKENPEALKLLETVFDKKNPTEISNISSRSEKTLNKMWPYGRSVTSCLTSCYKPVPWAYPTKRIVWTRRAKQSLNRC